MKAFWLFFCVVGVSWPALGQFPEIQDLSRGKDPLFLQLQDSISLYHQRNSQKKPLPELNIFSYRAKSGDTIFSLAARLGMPYDTLVSLNNLPKADSLTIGQRLLIPSLPGIFVNQDTPGVTELMGNWRGERSDPLIIKIPIDQKIQNLHFFPGELLHPLERAYFLGILFRLPLPSSRMTSRFGPRNSPFSGHPSYHNGIDLAAPEGTDVFAAREGIVKNTGFDRVFGNFVLLYHEGGYETLYGHLSKTFVSLNQTVELGKVLGRVGSTGLSTGPHLHFEIRRKGHPQDPVPLLPKKDY